MIFTATPLAGAHLIDLEPNHDERGYFSRTFCADEFRAHGLWPEIAQANVSYNARKGTLRGMHYQVAPHAETKVVSCARGAIFDVIVDVRPGSPTFRRWYGVELTGETGRALYVPEGFAHGFITLADDTAVSYLMGTRYVPGAGAGIRYDDPSIGIEWPLSPAVISERDLALPLLA